MTLRPRLHVLASLCLLPLTFACNGGDEEGTTEPVPETAAPAEQPVATPETPEQQETATAPSTGDRRMEPSEVFNTRARLGLEPPPNLMIADLLTRTDIREITQYEGTLAETSLAGIEPSPGYNAFRIASETGYGIGCQVWMVDESRQAVPRFRRLRDTYFEAEEDTTPVGDGAFFGTVESIRHYAFVHRSSRSVVVVTCETAICNQEHVRTLAERVLSRL